MGKKPAQERGRKDAKGKAVAAAKEEPPPPEPVKKTKKLSKLSKPKRVGGGGYHDDLASELAACGLRIKQIAADGNCFFRSLGDQLQGDEGLHHQLRAQIMNYVHDHPDDFAPFIEDDEPFPSYVARMRKDGCWAGNIELVAASHLLQVNLSIYQAGQARWTITNHPEGAPTLHLSYHDGLHWNSVRMADDYGHGAPAPIVLRPTGVVLPNGGAAAGARARGGGGEWGEREEARVMSSTACSDRALVRWALEEARGDPDVAIERVIERLSNAVDDDDGADGDAAVLPPPQQQEQQPLSQADQSDSQQAGPQQQQQQQQQSKVEPEGGGGRDADGVREQGTAGDAAPEGSTAAEDSRAADSDGPEPGEQQAGPPPGRTSPAAPSDAATGEAQHPAQGEALAAADEGVQPQVAEASSKVADAPAAKPKVAKAAGAKRVRVAAKAEKVKPPGRNQACPCGSKKKYKVCCGPAAEAAARRRAAGIPDEVVVPAVRGGSGAAAAAAAAAQLAAISI